MHCAIDSHTYNKKVIKTVVGVLKKYLLVYRKTHVLKRVEHIVRLHATMG